MNSLMLLLFLGATVALAEIHVDNDSQHCHNRRMLGLVSSNSLLSFCFVANSGYGKFYYQQSDLENRFQWSQISLLTIVNQEVWCFSVKTQFTGRTMILTLAIDFCNCLLKLNLKFLIRFTV